MKKSNIVLLSAALCICGTTILESSGFCNQLEKPVFAKTNTATSHQRLVGLVNSISTKETLSNYESTLIQAAETDVTDTENARNKDNSSITQKDLKSYENASDKFTKIASKSKKVLKNSKTKLTASDYNEFKQYSKALNKYIETLQDYASTLESEGAVKSDPDASASDKGDAQKDINKTQSKFNKAKANWTASYNKLTQAN